MEESHGKDEKRYIIAVAVIFDKNGKVLLTQRNAPEHNFSHLKWQLPGGGVEHTEHPRDTVMREIREELGDITVALIDQPYVFSVSRENGNEHIIGIAYPALYESGAVDISEDPETGDFKWIQTEEVDDTNSLEQTTEIVDAAKKSMTLWKNN